MKALAIALLLVAGCKSKEQPPLNLPRLEGPLVASTSRASPWVVVFVDARGKYGVASLEHNWPDRLPSKITDLNSGDVDALKLEVTKVMGIEPDVGAAGLDDPPPPEEEDRPDDGEDESGGTGTAMVLEEGRMGKRDSDRAEGQYKMKRPADPVLARQLQRQKLGARETFTEGRPYGRLPAGVATPTGDLTPSTPLIAATPDAPAIAIARVVPSLGALIAVSNNGALGLLAVGYTPSFRRGPSREWIEVHLDNDGIHVVAVPSLDKTVVAWGNAGLLDYKAFAAAIKKARTKEAGVDVLVGEGVTAQQLVDVLAELETQQAVVSLAPRTAPRGQRIVQLSQAREEAFPILTLLVSRSGDLAKTELRRAVESRRGKLIDCYLSQLKTKPALAGTITAQFSIGNNKADKVTADGVDPDVARCVADVLGGIVYPATEAATPVELSLTFRPRTF